MTDLTYVNQPRPLRPLKATVATLGLVTALLLAACSTATKPTAPQLPRAGVNGVTIPTCDYCPAPEYSEAARKAKLEGNVTVQATVTTDGRAENISILQGLGSGLDQKRRGRPPQARVRHQGPAGEDQQIPRPIAQSEDQPGI